MVSAEDSKGKASGEPVGREQMPVLSETRDSCLESTTRRSDLRATESGSRKRRPGATAWAGC